MIKKTHDTDGLTESARENRWFVLGFEAKQKPQMGPEQWLFYTNKNQHVPVTSALCTPSPLERVGGPSAGSALKPTQFYKCYNFFLIFISLWDVLTEENKSCYVYIT